MTIKSRVDPVRVGEEVFYNIFHRIFNDEGARKHFKFSQISFFTTEEGLPGWNLWFHENPGAYQLVLTQAQEVFDNDRLLSLGTGERGAVEGRFVMRYFPAEEDSLLDDFSCAETLLRLGPLFDSTGTPTLTGQESIAGNFFVVGDLDFRTDIERNFIELECIAPSRWKDVRVAGLYLKTSEGEDYEAVKPGAVDRNVAGWNLAFFLFDKLISGFCYANKTSPCEAIIAEKKWMRFDIEEDNLCTEVLDNDIDLFHLVAAFKLDPGDIKPTKEKNYSRAVSDYLTAQGFKLSDACKHLGGPQESKINPAWWQIKELKFSEDIESEMQHCCYHDH